MSDTQPLHVVAECRAKAGHEDALRKVLLAAVGPSRGDAGVVSYVVHEDIRKPGHFFFVEHYTSRDALKQHMQQPHFKALVEESKTLIDGEFAMSMIRPAE
jgi:quinol monooxygenase YgiN